VKFGLKVMETLTWVGLHNKTSIKKRLGRCLTALDRETGGNSLGTRGPNFPIAKWHLPEQRRAQKGQVGGNHDADRGRHSTAGVGGFGPKRANLR